MKIKSPYFGIIFLLISLFFTNCMAQKVAKFEDKDIENFVPLFAETVSGIAIVKTKSKDLPLENAAERVQFLTDSIAKMNSKLKYAEGYRIQVYLGTDKDEANKVKENMYKTMPEADLYAVYKQPVYRIKLGDFTDRLEANRVLFKIVKRIYPNAIVVPDNVFISKAK